MLRYRQYRLVTFGNEALRYDGGRTFQTLFIFGSSGKLHPLIKSKHHAWSLERSQTE
jgi:hypothetical protein